MNKRRLEMAFLVRLSIPTDLKSHLLEIFSIEITT